MRIRKSRLDNFDIDHIKKIIYDSYCWTDALKKLGYKTLSSSQRKILKNFCIKNGIDVSHFKSQSQISSENWDLRREELLQKWLNNDGYSVKCRSKIIRDFLIKECNNQCSICEIDSWNNFPLSLILDHIDGNSDNWEKDNLRMICPNCDSQTPTFKSRNRGKGRAYRRERYHNKQSY